MAKLVVIFNSYNVSRAIEFHLPEKKERAILPDGLLTRKLIMDSGARYADGTSLCGLAGSDFFVRDGHPNQQGIVEPFLNQER